MASQVSETLGQPTPGSRAPQSLQQQYCNSSLFLNSPLYGPLTLPFRHTKLKLLTGIGTGSVQVKPCATTGKISRSQSWSTVMTYSR